MKALSTDNVILRGKRALVRVDFNVPLTPSLTVADDKRIAESLPTIRKILDDGGSVILMSHLGRPKGKPNPEYSLKPVADRLAELLGKPVQFAPDCLGEDARAAAASLRIV